MKFIALVALLFVAITGHGQYDQITARKILQLPKFVDTLEANAFGARKARNLIILSANGGALAYRNFTNSKWLLLLTQGSFDTAITRTNGVLNLIDTIPDVPNAISTHRWTRLQIDSLKAAGFFGNGPWLINSENLISYPGSLYLPPVSNNGDNRNINFGKGYGKAALILYDGDAEDEKYGWGLTSAEMQFFIPDRPNHHFSFNSGGFLQANNSNELMRVQVDGRVGIGTITPATKLDVAGDLRIVVAEYANNEAAVAAGLVNGTLYRTGDLLKIVH